MLSLGLHGYCTQCRQHTQKQIIIDNKSWKTCFKNEKSDEVIMIPTPLCYGTSRLQASFCLREAVGGGAGQRGYSPKPHRAALAQRKQKQDIKTGQPHSHPTVHPQTYPELPNLTRKAELLSSLFSGPGAGSLFLCKQLTQGGKEEWEGRREEGRDQNKQDE